VLSDAFLAFLSDQKGKDKRASVPELIRRARRLGLIKRAPDRVTVYRACKRLGLPVGRIRKTQDRDARRFEYPHRMDMLLCDGKHFRAGQTRAKRVVFIYLDDATRFALHAVVGTSESKDLFLRGLFEVLCKWGMMSIAYLDRGPGFIADDVVSVIQRLDALLIHGEAGYPSGRGKIERFNRTLFSDLLRGFDRRPDVDPGCPALELRIAHYLDEIYNHRPHEGLRGQTPAARFLGDKKPLSFPDQSIQALRDRFVVHMARRVTNDHVVSVDSVLYEVPRGLAGQKVVIHRQVLDGTLRILHDGVLMKLHPLDAHLNAKSQRSRRGVAKDEEVQYPLPFSDADLGYQNDFGSVVDKDGGFIDPQPPGPMEPIS
jgi:transposase InsO family protein